MRKTDATKIVKADYDIISKFFTECVRYWERTMNLSIGDDIRPILMALNEVCDVDPNEPHGRPLDEYTRTLFIEEINHQLAEWAWTSYEAEKEK